MPTRRTVSLLIITQREYNRGAVRDTSDHLIRHASGRFDREAFSLSRTDRGVRNAIRPTPAISAAPARLDPQASDGQRSTLSRGFLRRLVQTGHASRVHAICQKSHSYSLLVRKMSRSRWRPRTSIRAASRRTGLTMLALSFTSTLAIADPCNAPLPAKGTHFYGEVTYIVDGDGLCVGKEQGGIEVRLADFNACELNEPGGQAAKEILRKIVFGKHV